MAATSTIAITGTLSLVAARRNTPVPISQSIGNIEAKGAEYSIAPGGAWVAVPLMLSVGVTEALFLAFYCPSTLLLKLTSSDTSVPGPMVSALKGWAMWTYAPAEGVVSVFAQNNSDDPITLEVYVGAEDPSGELPPYWGT